MAGRAERLASVALGVSKMITTVSSAAALNIALKAAQAGDTIQLAAGSYAGVVAQNLHFAQDVTITSAGATQAVLTGLSVNTSNGLNFSNLTFQANAAGGENPFQVNGSQDIGFDRLSVHGSMDGDPQNDVSAMLIRSSSDVRVTNSEFQQLKNGLSFTSSDHFTFSGNELHDIRTDGVHGTGSSWVTISGNAFHDFYAATGDHPDAIQFWTTGQTAPVHDLVITDNLYLRGAGTPAQGVFMNDEAGVHYRNVVISNNTMIGAQYNGIAIANGDGVTIAGNTVIGFGSMKSWVRLGGGDGATLTGNTTNAVVDTGQTHLTQSGTILVPTATDAGAAAYGQWLAQHAVTPPPGLQLPGGPGADTLTGGAGADTLGSGGGSDLLTGGAGDDTYVVNTKAAIAEAAGGGHDSVLSSSSHYTLSANVEDLTLTVSWGAQGGGNALDNRITGGAGGDYLTGDAGADTLIGGGGPDTFTGGPGADSFVFAKGDGADVIKDFGAGGEHDVLDLSALLSLGLKPTLVEAAAGVTVSFTSADTVFLAGVHTASLHATAAGFIF
ncbi:MAG: hypothetical protein JWQ29_1324 [Phenylobacterium sp.]|nr:hypothetical protein [Phenylobacterium sp.]